MDTLVYDNLSLSMMIWGITIAVLFIVMVFGMWRNIIFLRACHKEMIARIRELRLSKMLGHLNIPLARYYHKTSDLDKERHIRKCKSCPDPEQCQSMLEGEDVEPYTFCPNYYELRKLEADYHPEESVLSTRRGLQSH
jgi:hypothetical protein